MEFAGGKTAQLRKTLSERIMMQDRDDLGERHWINREVKGSIGGCGSSVVRFFETVVVD